MNHESKQKMVQLLSGWSNGQYLNDTSALMPVASPIARLLSDVDIYELSFYLLDFMNQSKTHFEISKALLNPHVNIYLCEILGRISDASTLGN
jgi:hypothetical protein